MDAPLQVVQTIAIVAAVIVGGLWTLWGFTYFRQGKLSIDFSLDVHQSSKPVNGTYIVSLLFIMKNDGARALKLMPEKGNSFKSPLVDRNPGTLYERKAFRNCELLLWRIEPPVDATGSVIYLADKAKAVQIDLGAHPVNLLEVSAINPNTFWLEPGETVRTTTNCYLPMGYYTGSIRTLFRLRSLTTRARYTFDVFSFSFEVGPGKSS
jgi:hypothetical protein